MNNHTCMAWFMEVWSLVNGVYGFGGWTSERREDEIVPFFYSSCCFLSI